MTTTATDLSVSHNTHDFRSTQIFKAPPAKVLDAVTTIDGVSDWWSRSTGGAGDGDELTVWFGDRHMRATVCVADNPSRVEWAMTSCDAMADWVGTTVVFDIAPFGDGAVLSFAHVGLNPQLECFSQCFAGWTFFMGSLVDYVDNDGGTPNGSPADQKRRTRE